MNKTIFILFFVGIFSGSLLAQSGGSAGALTRLGFGPRAISMGNAMTASTSEGVYPYYNPALAAIQTEQIQFDASVSSLQFDRIYQNIGANFQLPPTAGLYVGLIRSGVKNIDQRSLSGYPLGTIDLSEYQLFTAFGLRFGEKFRAGIGFKLNYANYHEDISPATAVGIDFGVLYRINEQLQFGFTAQDMIANFTWNSSNLYNQPQSRNVVDKFPTRFKWGLSFEKESYAITTEYEIQVYTSEVTSSEVFLFPQTGFDIIRDTKEIKTNAQMLRIGGSWKAHQFFTLRGGYQITESGVQGNNAISAGFSLHLPIDTFSPTIDYAFVSEPYQVANMHVFALRLHL
ncbi:MAG TPA: hypothetical protein DEQ34_14330 [Balneolaceae bacterium]|nr:hypothetical protein [Balneolaceae bacterium]|tara:strand:- start:60747 stop:61778 length:1032 start_codon:yes stop_codon:yes gene_type:complete